MHKIPVGATISGAYGFAFGNILSVLGIVWFPYVLLIAVIVGAVFGLAPDLPGHLMRGEFDISMFDRMRRIEPIIWLAAILFGSMMTVGLQQKALGLHKGPSFVYFSLGAPVWRMIGASILVGLVILLISVLTVLATMAISFAAHKFVPHFGRAIAAVAILAAVLWIVYACVRLVFFLPAVVVAENKIGIGRSWELSTGNFWRIVAVWFVVFVPVLIGFDIVLGALVAPFVSLPNLMQHFGHPTTPGEIAKAEMATVSFVLKQILGVLPFILILDVIMRVVLVGLGNGAVAKAYLGVTSSESSMSGGAA